MESSLAIKLYSFKTLKLECYCSFVFCSIHFKDLLIHGITMDWIYRQIGSVRRLSVRLKNLLMDANCYELDVGRHRIPILSSNDKNYNSGCDSGNQYACSETIKNLSSDFSPNVLPGPHWNGGGKWFICFLCRVSFMWRILFIQWKEFPTKNYFRWLFICTSRNIVGHKIHFIFILPIRDFGVPRPPLKILPRGSPTSIVTRNKLKNKNKKLNKNVSSS